MNWITTLKKCGVPHDWMVILVEAPDSRKATNKLLPRASVVDKLRTDIGTKNADRCFSLLGTYQFGSGFFFDDEFLLRKVSVEQFCAICKKPIVNFTKQKFVIKEKLFLAYFKLVGTHCTLQLLILRSYLTSFFVDTNTHYSKSIIFVQKFQILELLVFKIFCQFEF